MKSKNCKEKNVDNTKITCLEWCAGYGGIGIGLKRAIPTLCTIAFSEIEAYACANLVAKMEAGLLDVAPIWTDLKAFPCEEFRRKVDILVAGYPCQPFSQAGKRLGTEDPRHLWPFIYSAIRVIRPRIVFFENVEGHISLGLREVIDQLEKAHYKATWGIFSASEVGAPHQRKRVFILAYDERKGLQGFGRFIQEPVSEGWQGAHGHAWPSRPGEPQHGWEPPRVVSALEDSISTRSGGESGNTLHEGRRASETGRESLSKDSKWEDGSSISDDQSAGGDGGEKELGDTPSLRPCGPCEDSRTTDQDSDGKECGVHESQGTSSLPRHESQSEAMGNSHGMERRGASDIPRDSQERSTNSKRLKGSSPVECDGKTESSMGRDVDGNSHRLDDAELFISTDNRTDELRLLGNGVVPAVAERAFRHLIKELIE